MSMSTAYFQADTDFSQLIVRKKAEWYDLCNWLFKVYLLTMSHVTCDSYQSKDRQQAHMSRFARVVVLLRGENIELASDKNTIHLSHPSLSL